MNELNNVDEFLSIDFGVDSQDVAYVPDSWQADRVRGAWFDGYTARTRVFEDGQCEVTVCRDRAFVGPAMTPKTKAKRGESDKPEASEDVSGRRAKKQVRLCCKTIGADRMVTLTYRENMTDRDRAVKDWKAFCRRVGKVKAFHYVAVLEAQERGALHFHVAVRGRQSYALLRSIWQRVVGRDEAGREMGQVNVRDPHRFGFGNKGAHKIASYIAKYCGKDVDRDGSQDDLNKKRYFRSRGIVVPEVTSWRLPCTNMLQAVNAAFAALTGHSLAGLQSWCNNGLGVVYLATEPGWLSDRDICPF